MRADLINVGLAFLEGFALIISPCILPILPIILSGSLTGKKSRPIGIVIGFIIFFTLFTLFSRVLIQHTNINLNTIRNISFIILLLIGIIMMSTRLTELVSRLMQPFANIGNDMTTINNPESGFFSGILFGGLVGIIWTPCAGPLLAAVIVQVVLQKTTLDSIFVVIAFAIGAGIPMLLIALLGRSLMSHLNFLRQHAVRIRQILGAIIVLTVLYFAFFQGVSFSWKQNTKTNITNASSLINGIEPYAMPEISGISDWINSQPLTTNDLKGKVVLIDFWTYSCINCIRTLPYLKEWYAKYHDDGFEIIGVHSPEFQFEHDLANVKNAVLKENITYPVALDNQFTTWRNFQNEYWPAHYLVNKEGQVVYVHFGEGEYDVTENNIRFLLGLDKMKSERKPEERYSLFITPETYLGYRRAERFASPSGIVKDSLALYDYPAELGANEWALKGSWLMTSEKVVALSPNASIQLRFRGEKVYMVMGVTTKPVTVKLMLNGKPLLADFGKDVKNGEVIVDQNRLYALVDLAHDNSGVLEIIALSPGLEVYTFTFG